MRTRPGFTAAIVELGFGVVISAALLSETALARPAETADRWPNRGQALARLAIDQCLVEDASGPFDVRLKCVRSAFNKCESEHGTQSQHDLTDCAALSANAWHDRLEATIARIDASAGSSQTLLSAQLQSSQRAWTVWNDADCKTQSSVYAGGSLEAFVLQLCLSDHAAVRAVELSDLQEDLSH